LQGINDYGTIVGYYQTVTDNSSATGIEIENGRAAERITYPSAVYTEPHGINNNGDMVGWYALKNSPGAAFLRSAGHFTTFSYQGHLPQ
jgi:hypothetical protein